MKVEFFRVGKGKESWTGEIAEMKKSTDELILTKGLPGSLEAEKALLGMLLYRPDLFQEIVGQIESHDFTSEAHRRIFIAGQFLQNSSAPLNRITIAEELVARRHLESVGGLSYLVALDTVTQGVPESVATLRYYASILREKTFLRKLLILHDLGMQRCMNGDRAIDVLGGTVDAMRELTAERAEAEMKPKTAREVIDQMGGLQAFINGKSDGLKTPWPMLNEITAGLLPGSLWILAARPSCGKTTAALQMSVYAGMRGKSCAFFTLEMPAGELIKNAIASLSGVDSSQIRHGFLDQTEREAVAKAGYEVSILPIEYFSGGDNEPNKIRARIAIMLSRSRVDLVVIDYLQLMSSGHRSHNQNENISQITRGLKSMSTEFGVPFLVLSQLSRDPAKANNRAPQLEDLRDSGSIEQDADVVVFLHRPEKDDRTQTKMMVAKNRLGPIGKFDLEFQSKYCRFREITGASE